MRPRGMRSLIITIVLSGVFLLGWFLFWEVKNQGIGRFIHFTGLLPVSEEKQTDIGTIMAIADQLMQTNGETKTFLLLFQNNMELRPGGGFIGSFGILKVQDGHILEFSVHDTGNFDGRIPSTVEPPYPMRETLRIDSWKLRDSNYSPDFAENAKQAVRFYEMGAGAEKFDGVVGITTNVLSSFLAVTGPVTLEGFPGEYGTDNAILDLEYQVEQGYLKQGIEFGERKSVMGMLGNEILQKAKALPLTKKYELFNVLLDDLHKKDIQLSFRDEALQDMVVTSGWDGHMDQRWPDDYLFVVDANLGAWKSDYYVHRSYDYTVDLSAAKPKATLMITYRHTATVKSYLAKDYLSYLRVYVPAGSFIGGVTNGDKPVYGEEFGKKYVGVLVSVPLGGEKTVTLSYELPETLEREWYDLLWQKQAGVNDAPATVSVKYPDGHEERHEFTLNRDTVLSELGE